MKTSSLRHRSDRRGFIIPVGGAERKLRNPDILNRFVELSGGKDGSIAVTNKPGLGIEGDPDRIARYMVDC